MTAIDLLRRNIRGIVFPYPIVIAGGVFKHIEHLMKFAPTEVIPVWGSIETDYSAGNGGKDYISTYTNGVLINTRNSRGIPNPGMTYVEEHARDLIAAYADHGKPLIINVSGKNVQDAISLVRRALMCGFRVIVINGACPNKGGQPILCWDTESVSELFAGLETEIGATDCLVLWKVSAGMPRNLLEHNRKCVEDSKVVSGIVTCNTLPNTYDIDDDGAPTILTEKNALTRGGLAGPAILPIALDHTEYCAQKMPPGKFVFGAGGAMNARDAFKFLRSGATIVKLHSAFLEANEPLDFVQRLCMDLAPMLAEWNPHSYIQ